MVDETKLHSPVCSTFEVMAVQCVVRRCPEELGLFCGSMLAAGLAVSGAPHRFAEHTSQR